MQQHPQGKPKRRPKRNNANHRLGTSDIAAIEGLLGAFSGQEGFDIDYLRSQYLSKFCDDTKISPESRRSAAIRKWIAQESINAGTNARIRGLDRGYNLLPRVTFYAFLKFAQRLIESVLGPLSNEVVLGSFSGGASTSRRRTESHPGLKFLGKADATSEAVKFVDVIHHESPLFRQHGFLYLLNEVEGAVLFTVPKKSDIDRCACKEPDVNMFLQKGVGHHIRSRLRRFGINLNDQSINRRLARQGSLDDSLATLDLSSASDSICTSVVQALLPTDWFLYLNDIRSQVVDIDGTLVRTEMFSSMGNGFTFELESLIFWALMRTVAYFENYQGVISVYGDDLIIPSGMYEMATHVLREFGFSVNLDKSYSSGPFRESCGGHYHLGVDVTPFYLKRKPTHLTDVIRVANQLRRWAMADPARQYVLPSTYKVWKDLAERVPRDLWGGYDLGLDTQLCSPHPCRKRLVRHTIRKEVPDLGLYLQWHNNSRDRCRGAIESFPPVDTTNYCVKRAATPGAPVYQNEFHEELIEVPSSAT